MCASTPSSRQGRAYQRAEIEQLLRDALVELLADGASFRELSVEKLVRSGGIARSTFYVYFDDKTAMLESLSAATLQRLYSAQRLWLAKGATARHEDVRAGMVALFHAFRQDEAVMRSVAEASVYDPRIREAYLSGVSDYVRALERFIRKAQKDGRADAGLHPGDTAASLAWMTERTVSQVGPGASRRRIDSTAGALASIVCATLSIPAA